MSIALDDNTVLCYKSEDLEIQLTTVGDISAEGDVTIYFGDYSILSRRYFITYNLALDVLNDWIKTGEFENFPFHIGWKRNCQVIHFLRITYCFSTSLCHL